MKGTPSFSRCHNLLSLLALSVVEAMCRWLQTLVRIWFRLDQAELRGKKQISKRSQASRTSFTLPMRALVNRHPTAYKRQEGQQCEKQMQAEMQTLLLKLEASNIQLVMEATELSEAHSR